MKSRIPLLKTLTVLALSCCAPVLHAAPAPQDNWRSYANSGWSIPGTARNLAAGPDGSIYTVVETASDTTIHAFSPAGTFLRQFVTLPAGTKASGMDIDASGNLFLFAGNTRKVMVYDASGNLLREWGGAGTGNGLFGSVSFNTPWSLLALDSNGNVYVVDMSNRLVQKFTTDGTFLLQWGGAGNLVGQLGSSGAMSIATTPDDKILVLANVSSHQAQLFNPDGTIWRAPTYGATSLLSSNSQCAVLPDGLLVLPRVSNNLILLDPNLGGLATLTNAAAGVAGLTTDPRGNIYYLTNSGGTPATARVSVLERSYLVENPPVYNALPLPVLIAAEQRPSTPYVDIDYKVVDADDATVQVAVLGFQNGGNDLSKVLKISTFVEDTAGHVGPAQPSNQVRRVTWNAAADWSVEFGDVQFEVLAKDGRGLMPFHWITVPAQGAAPALTISQRPVAEAEWLHLWYWLIATNQPGIVLADGQITATSGVHSGQVLAATADNVSTTTAEGRAWLCEKLNIRSITADELARATAGQFGFTEVTELSVVQLPAITP